MNETNFTWKSKLHRLLYGGAEYVSKPRGMEVLELIGDQYHMPMPAYIDYSERKINVAFMFKEAAWIVSGNNRLSEILPFMKFYGNFSDDGVFMRGAYGPKIADQLGYVVDAIEADNDTRQAVINIWRERPGKSKDIPCTISMQFIMRNDRDKLEPKPRKRNKLHAIVTMRSNDIIKGFTYDVFTFSMVANAVRLLLKARGIETDLGELTVNVGSLHLYSPDYEKARKWEESFETDPTIVDRVIRVMEAQTYEELIERLNMEADDARQLPTRV